MRSSKTSLLVVLMFVVALAAGAVAGKLATRNAAPAGSLDDLHLSQTQRDQMRQVWESVQETAENCRKDAEAAQKAERDQLIAMLTDNQKATYAQLTSATSVRIIELNEKRKAAVRDAIAKTEGLLSQEQRKEYQKIIRDRLGALTDPTAGAQPHLDWEIAPAQH
jgi:uncharacterized membrane protein